MRALCYAKTPFRCFLSNIVLNAWIARPHFHLLNVADFKDVHAG